MREPNRTDDGQLACVFGQPYMTAKPVGSAHCIECWKYGQQLARQFADDVFNGRCDERGYTIAERRALRKAGIGV